MSDIAIRVENLGKMYRIGVADGQPRTAWQAARSLAASPFAYLRRMARPPTAAETLWALRNVSFEVRRGEVLGMIGRNGAGKSTLLKILARITEPTEGRADIHGRVGSLLEVGTGFHPELTGRENIYLNGAILGMKRAEIDRQFDEIVAFAEIERFLDTPVKRYSSGMYVRLAFAVAAHLKPEILLVDEVLAVGDAAFQYKCLGRIRDLVSEGATVAYVSHNLDAIQGLCSRAIWVNRGNIEIDGSAPHVIEAYLSHDEIESLSRQGKNSRSASGPLKITGVTLRDGSGAETDVFASGEDLVVELQYDAEILVPSPIFSIGISDQGTGILILATMLLDGPIPSSLLGIGVVQCHFSKMPLMPKSYQVWGSVRDEHGFRDIVAWQVLGGFRVTSPPKAYLQRGECISISHLKNDAPIYIPHEWSVR